MDKLIYLAIVATQAVELQVVTYNMFGRPHSSGYDGQSERLKLIPQALYDYYGPDIDAYALQELFCPESANVYRGFMCGYNQNNGKELLAEFNRLGYKYHTDIPHHSIYEMIVNMQLSHSSGVIIVSKHPIISENTYVFKAGNKIIMNTKGLVHARILKQNEEISKYYNLVSMHLEPFLGYKQTNDRYRQSEEARVFISSLNLNKSEPLIVMGDTNMDYIKYSEELTFKLNNNNLKVCKLEGELIFTSDPVDNFLVGKDGDAEDNGCFDQYNDAVKDESFKVENSNTKYFPNKIDPLNLFTDQNKNKFDQSLKYYCMCCNRQLLDFVMYSLDHKQPSREFMKIGRIKSRNQLKYRWTYPGIANYFDTFEAEGYELSDHNPVYAYFEFEDE